MSGREFLYQKDGGHYWVVAAGGDRIGILTKFYPMSRIRRGRVSACARWNATLRIGQLKKGAEMSGYYARPPRDRMWNGVYANAAQRLLDFKVQHPGPYTLVEPYTDPTTSDIRAADGTIFRRGWGLYT